MFIDTHAHLNFEKFTDDLESVIDRAKKAGVEKIIVPSSNLETSKKAIEIAEEYPSGLFAAVGLHPIHVKDESFDVDAFEKLIANKKVVAIGETGLDYYYDKSNIELQKEVFRKHLILAGKFDKPLILHSRDAGEDVLSVLMESRGELRGVMHCFSGDWQYAKIVLEMGLYISFTGLITFSKNYDTFEVIENAPLDRILIETDCPYMTPELYRGKRNEPAYVVEVAKKIAEIKKISLNEVAEQTSQNAIELFRLKIS